MCKEAKLLILISCVFTVAMGLSGVFVNIFFWKQSKSFIVIALYNLMHYVSTPLTFIAAGWLAKKKNGIWSLRLGLLFFALFFGLIVLAGKNAIHYVYPLGVLFGIASGFYWLAYNTLSFDFTSLNNRDTFNGYNGSCAGIAGVIAPISASYIISKFSGIRGYSIIFAITLVLFVLLIIISLFLKCDNYSSKLDFAKAIGKNCRDWCCMRKAILSWGLRDVTIVFIINILVIQTTGSELTIGKLSMIGAIIASISNILVQKLVKPPGRKVAAYLGGVLSFASVWGLFFSVNYNTLLLYVILDSFFLPFFMIQLSSTTFNVIERAHEEKLRIEYMINRELMLNAGRVVSVSVLILMLVVFKGGNVIKYYLIIIGVAPIIAAYFVVKLKSVLSGK